MPQDPNKLLMELYDMAEQPVPGQEETYTPQIVGSESPSTMAQDTGQPFQNTGYQTTSGQHDPSNPPIPPGANGLLSLEDMIKMVNARTELATQPRLDALDRARDQMNYDVQKRMQDVTVGYDRARQNLGQDVNLQQQQMAQTTARRGIYDSGLAAKLGNQISMKGVELGLQLGEEQSRQLADIAEYLHLQSRHNMEEIQSIMGEKGLMAQVMLDEMRLEQQARGDALAQREFENWLAMQAHELNEYWRQQEFDAGRADAEYQQWFNEEQMRVQMEHMEWERIFNMNKFEAEHELNRMLADNQISQQEFMNAIMLDEFALKQRMFQLQSRDQANRHAMGWTQLMNSMQQQQQQQPTTKNDWYRLF